MKKVSIDCKTIMAEVRSLLHLLTIQDLPPVIEYKIRVLKEMMKKYE